MPILKIDKILFSLFVVSIVVISSMFVDGNNDFYINIVYVLLSTIPSVIVVGMILNLYENHCINYLSDNQDELCNYLSDLRVYEYGNVGFTYRTVCIGGDYGIEPSYSFLVTSVCGKHKKSFHPIFLMGHISTIKELDKSGQYAKLAEYITSKIFDKK